MPRRIAALDGVRGLAILTVVGYHAWGFPAAGCFGVDLFFVLSGYLITRPLVAEWQRDRAISLRRFWGRRARRLLPAVVLYLGTLLAVAVAVGERLEYIAAVGAASLYTTNLIAMLGLLGSAATWIGGLWSLAAEEQFYLVWPFVLLALLPVGVARLRAVTVGLVALAVAGFAVTAVFGGVEQLHYSPLARSMGIVVGCFLAIRPVRFPGGLPAGLCLFAGGCLLGDPSMGGFSWFAPIAIMGAGLLVTNADGSRVLASRPLVWLGAISYALYLWHPFFLHVIHYQAVALVFAVAVSYISTRWVEDPIRHRTLRWRWSPKASDVGANSADDARRDFGYGPRSASGTTPIPSLRL